MTAFLGRIIEALKSLLLLLLLKQSFGTGSLTESGPLREEDRERLNFGGKGGTREDERSAASASQPRVPSCRHTAGDDEYRILGLRLA